MQQVLSKKEGFTLVEAVIGAAIILLLFTGMVALYAKYVKAFSDTTDSLQAQYLLEEGLEVARVFRDTSWAQNVLKLSTTTSYTLAFSTTTSTWATSTTPTLINGLFDRRLTVSEVMRDSSTKDVVQSGGVYDGNIRLFTISVSWNNGGATTTKSLSGYLTNLFLN